MTLASCCVPGVPRSVVTATAAQIVTEHCKPLLIPSHPIFGPWLVVLVRVCVFLEVIGSSSGLASPLLNVTLRDVNVTTSDKCGHMARSADTQLCLVQSVCVCCAWFQLARQKLTHHHVEEQSTTSEAFSAHPLVDIVFRDLS